MILTDEKRKELINAALEGQKEAYAPYSKFRVGAAVLGEDGVIYKGCNIENASYGLTVCGERTAIFNMVAAGCKTFVALSVVAADEPGDSAPCGACRQVIAEFCKDLNSTPIIVAGKNGAYNEYTPIELMPHAFTKFVPNE